MTIEKKLKNFGKKAIIVTALAGSLVFSGCGLFDKGDQPNTTPITPPVEEPIYPPYPNPSPVPVPNDPNPESNDAPVATILRDFGNGLSGNVDYTFCGADPDRGDYINYLDTELNASPLRYTSIGQYNPYCENESVPIVPGNNDAQVIASDNNGLEGIAATDTFDSPTEEQVRAKIEELLAREGFTKDANLDTINDYYTDLKYSTPDGQVNADLLLWTKNGYKVIAFIPIDTDPTTDLTEKQYLDNASVSNLYVRGLPLPEIENRFNVFAINNF